MTAPLDRHRLSKLCGLFGSAHPSERANAAMAADRMVRQAGLTWRDVIMPSPAPEPNGCRAKIDVCLRRFGALTEWERAFLASLRRQQYPLTSRQRECLDRTLDRLRATEAA